MAEHNLKCDAVPFDAIKLGLKLFEVRQNVDRNFQSGDTCILNRQCASSMTGIMRFDGQRLRCRVGWILQGGQYGIEPGYCVFSIHDVEVLNG